MPRQLQTDQQDRLCRHRGTNTAKPKMNTMQNVRVGLRLVGAAVFVSLAIDSGSAAEFYVDPVWGNDTNSGSISAPWKTINRAVKGVAWPWEYRQPGDTVYLRGGEYRGVSNYIALAAGNSGTSKAPIVLAAYPGERPVICDSVTQAAVDLRYKGWWVFDGLTFSNNYRHCWLVEITNCTFRNCIFERCNTNSSWQYSGVCLANDGKGDDGCMYNVFSNNVFRCWGWVTADCNDQGVSLSISGYSTANYPHYYNLVVSNTFVGGAHDHLQLESGYNVIRGNLFVNAPWIPTNETCNGLIIYTVPRTYEPNPYGAYGNRHTKPGDGDAGETWESQFDMRNVFEGNRFLYTGPPPDDNGAFGIELGTSYSIYRHNVIAFSLAAGIFFNTSGPYSRSTSNAVYGNVLYANGLSHLYGGRAMQGVAAGIATSNYQTAPRRTNNFVVNNIVWHNYPTNLDKLTQLAQKCRSNFTDDSVDPLFISTNGIGYTFDPNNLPDFRLRRGSPCIDAGTWLAYTVGDGSGTILRVDNSLYFSDGNRVVEGDTIQLQGQTATSVVVSNDWRNNVLYISSPLTWTNGQGVSLRYFGSAPDQGAFEYNPRGAPDPVAPPKVTPQSRQ